LVFGIVLKKVVPIAIAGLGIMAIANILRNPSGASQSAGALGQTLGAFGTGLGSLGGGIGELLSGIGSGSASLLDPLFSLKTLFYGDGPSMILSENESTSSNTSRQDPVVNTGSDQPGVTPSAPASSTVTWSSPGDSFTSTTTSTTQGVTTQGVTTQGTYTSRAAGRATRYG